MKRNKVFNIIIVGIGGQGLITLLQILAQAALSQRLDIKTSELHGLAQRGGSVQVHLRFGKKVFSPLVPQKSADLIIALEAQEALNGLHYAKEETVFLINEYIKPLPAAKRSLSAEKIIKKIEKTSRQIFLVPASKISKEQLKNEVLAGVYLIGLAVFKKFLPFDKISLLEAIKRVMPAKYLSANLRAIALAEKNVKK